jgi:hypothetical protein
MSREVLAIRVFAVWAVTSGFLKLPGDGRKTTEEVPLCVGPCFPPSKTG